VAAVPTTPKGRRTRALILEAARQVFAREGYVTLRMSDVASEAGVSMGALYRYFQNKEDLFVHLMGDIHEELFEASRAQAHDFRTAPYDALLEANRGYLGHYRDNRDVMRAFIEAATVDTRFRDIWWGMRQRHVERFVHALEAAHGISRVDGVDTALVAEAMASMVEQSAYAWFAHEELNAAPVTLENAAHVVARIWYRAFFDRQSPA
jgi:AcrR family transcriptional regulator